MGFNSHRGFESLPLRHLVYCLFRTGFSGCLIQILLILDFPFFYLFYFAALGAFAPYWSVYLKHLSFNAIEIGQLTALFMFTKLIAPFVWGWLADHTGKRLKWVRLAAFLTIPSLLLIFFNQSYFWIAFAMFLFGFFWNASLPQFEALTLNHLGKKSSDYSKVRLWGSVGFIIAVACLPLLFKQQSIDSFTYCFVGYILLHLVFYGFSQR